MILSSPEWEWRNGRWSDWVETSSVLEILRLLHAVSRNQWGWMILSVLQHLSDMNCFLLHEWYWPASHWNHERTKTIVKMVWSSSHLHRYSLDDCKTFPNTLISDVYETTVHPTDGFRDQVPTWSNSSNPHIRIFTETFNSVLCIWDNIESLNPHSRLRCSITSLNNLN